MAKALNREVILCLLAMILLMLYMTKLLKVDPDSDKARKDLPDPLTGTRQRPVQPAGFLAQEWQQKVKKEKIRLRLVTLFSLSLLLAVLVMI